MNYQGFRYITVSYITFLSLKIFHKYEFIPRKTPENIEFGSKEWNIMRSSHGLLFEIPCSS